MMMQQSGAIPPPVPGPAPVPYNQPGEKMPAAWYSFHGTFIFIEMVIIFLFGFCAQYNPVSAMITQIPNRPLDVASAPGFFVLYPYHQDIIVMAFIGLAFLTAYLKYNNLSSISVAFVTAVLTIQVYIIFRCFWRSAFHFNDTDWDIVPLDYSYFLTSLYAIVAVTVTWFALIGKVGPCQMLYIAIVETFIYALLEQIIYTQLDGIDLGGAMTVFAFAGIYGLAAALALYNGKAREQSDIRNHLQNGLATTFALIGTLFLWVFWPSLNAARLVGDIRYGLGYGNPLHLAVLNTVLCLTGSVVGTFITSAMVNSNQFNIEHFLKATISGGVVMGASADICIDPFGAILTGVFSGFTTTLLLNFCQHRSKHIDTIGTVWIFLWNGILGGFWSAIYVGGLREDRLGFLPELILPQGRTANGQAGTQLATLGISLVVGLVGGLLNGIVVRFCSCFKPQDKDLYAQDAQILFPPTDLAVQANLAPPRI